MLQYNSTIERYFFHDLVSEYALNLNREFQVGRILHAIYYAKLASQIEKAVFTGGSEFHHSLKLWDLEQRNIEAGQYWAATNLNSLFRGPALESLVNYATALTCISIRFEPEKAIKWSEDAIFAVNKYSWLGQHQHTLPPLYLSIIYSSLRGGEFDKVQVYAELLVRKLKEETLLVALVYSLLAVVYHNMGYSEKSMLYHEKSKTILINVKIESPQDVNMLNFIHFHDAYIRGDISGMEASWKLTKQGNIAVDVDVLFTLSLESAKQKDFLKSIKYIEDARELLKLVDSTELYITLNMVEATIYCQMDDYEKSLAACSEGEKRLAYRNNPFILGQFYRWSGLSYYFMNDHENAQKHLTIALKLLEQFKTPAIEEKVNELKELLNELEEMD